MSGNGNNNTARNFLAREFPPFKKSSVLERCREFMPLIAAANDQLKKKTEEGLSTSLNGISIVPIARKNEMEENPKGEDVEMEKEAHSPGSSSDSSEEEDDPNAIEFEIDVRGGSDSESEAEIEDSDIPEAFKKPIDKTPKNKLIEVIDEDQ